MIAHPGRPTEFRSQGVKFGALPPLSLYIHVPWCLHKCPYCDFNSHELKGHFQEAEYVSALIQDLQTSLPLIRGRKILTVFFGGGTPSLLGGDSIERIMSSVGMLLPLAADAEITLEANPGTAEASRFAAYRKAGVNRLSIGIQSFNDKHLRALGRIHSAEESKRAIEIGKQHFDNLNLDLMYGLPGQTLQDAVQDVRTALAFEPQHLSCYHLALEPNTAFFHYPPDVPDEDAVADMQQNIESLAAAAGFDHYETSAFAQCGSESRHNLNYWQFGDYLGIGAGAHSKLTFWNKVIRQARYKQPRAYLERVADGQPIQTEHEIPPGELGFEFMMNALRLIHGFDSVLFQERTNLPLQTISRPLDDAMRRGLLSRDHLRIAPTLLGQRFLNNLLETFLN